TGWNGEFRVVPGIEMADATGKPIQRAERELEFASVLPHADPRGQWLARARIFDHETNLGRGLAKSDTVDLDRLTLASLEIHPDQRRGALVIFRMHEPAAVAARARPIFIGLAEGDFP